MVQLRRDGYFFMRFAKRWGFHRWFKSGIIVAKYDFMAEETTTAGSGIIMAVILVFLLLGGLIVYFFGDLIFTAAAFALLAALLIGQLGLSPWIQTAWVSVTSQPIILSLLYWGGLLSSAFRLFSI